MNSLLVLPVIVGLAIMAIQSIVVEAHNVILFDERMTHVDIGVVTAETTTLGEFKKIVLEHTNIEQDQIRLTTDDNLMLDDEKLLSDYMKINDPSLVVKIRNDLTEPGTINVDTYEKRIEIVVTKKKTLSWLKKQAVGYDNAKLYRVFFDGNELFDESKTIEDLQIYKDAYLILFKVDDRFEVELEFLTEPKKQFHVTLETTVSDLKQMIKDQGFDITDCVLLHNDKPLEDEKKLFKYSKAFPLGLSIKAVRGFDEAGGKIVVYYKTPDLIGHFWVSVKPNNTISELKAFIFNIHKSVKVNNMELRFNDQILDDDSRFITDFKIYPRAWIEMKNRLC